MNKEAKRIIIVVLINKEVFISKVVINGSIKSLCFAVESFLGEVRVFDDFVSVHDLEHVFSFLEFVNI
tara:strand:- start:1 stop:204 length:204 start_codon:yes stop_codon:yes gene_type:complete